MIYIYMYSKEVLSRRQFFLEYRISENSISALEFLFI